LQSAFHPERSTVNPDRLADFLNREITGDLIEIPGIGPKTVELLRELQVSYNNNGSVVHINGITSTYALIGVFLSMKSEFQDGKIRTVDTVEHAQRFYLWWCSLNTPRGFRAGVVHSICEKCNISFPGIYNPSDFGDF